MDGRQSLGYGLQVVGALLVLLGLAWTWIGWSDHKWARWARARTVAIRSWWLRVRGKSVSGSMTAHLAAASEASAAGTAFRATPTDDADLLVWVKYLESRIESLREELASERERVNQRFTRERQQIDHSLVALREQLEREIEQRHRALRETNLNGIAVAAGGGVLTFIGLLVGWPSAG